MRKRLASAFCIAALATSAAAQPSGVSIEALAYSAIQQVCIPLLRGERQFSSPDEEQAFLSAQGLRVGISPDQLALFPPPHDATLNRATLLSGERNGRQFFMAIGGAERSCRLFMEHGAGQDVNADTIARLFTAADGWQPAPIPAGASPRIGFIGGDAAQPNAIALILLTNQQPGIGYTVRVVAR